MAGSSPDPKQSQRRAGRKATGTTRSRNRQTKTAKSRGSGRGFWAVLADILFLTFFGRLFLVAGAIAAVLALNVLISRNQTELFFVITGIELVATALVFWLRLALRRA